MNPFNVLDKNQTVLSHCLLEASAGTGKTFSIENIVIRLLLEEKEGAPPLDIDKILVVTFTRAAARELRQRIFNKLVEALEHLKKSAFSTPGYLQVHLEDEKKRNLAIYRLESALFAFDRAEIFTIHGFCARVLAEFPFDGDASFQNHSDKNTLSNAKLKEILNDYFRTELREEKISYSQLKILLKNDPDHKKLLNAIQKGENWVKLASYKKQFDEFCEKIKALKVTSSLGLIEDFQTRAPYYKNYKSGETKASTLEKITRFAKTFDSNPPSYQDFDVWIEEGLIFLEALAPSLAKKKEIPPLKLNYPDFEKELEALFGKFIEEAKDFSFILARTAADCRNLLSFYNEQEELFSPDDLLAKAAKMVARPSFASKVREKYKAVMIDEFQDTDPLQWTIFETLFLSEKSKWPGYLYLVGDPKQSIYSFRKADIYTYLKASSFFKKEQCFSLETNYRSKPLLIEALNAFFDASHAPSWIVLPKIAKHLPYLPAKVPDKADKEEEAFLHFFVAECADPKTKLQELEEKVYFPFIANEIATLYKEKKIPLSQIAVLIKDQFQGKRLERYLEKVGIACLNQKGERLAESPVFEGLTDFLRALGSEKEHSALFASLGSPLIGWTDHHFEKNPLKDQLMLACSKLRTIFNERGFAAFFEKFLQTSFFENKETVEMALLKRQGGLFLYRDLQQLADHLIEKENKEWFGLSGIVPFLDQLNAKEEAKTLTRLADPSENRVKIMTVHFSKGLEFEAVFALALACRTHSKEELFLFESEDKKSALAPACFSKTAYKSHLEEVDAEKMRQLYVALTRAKRYLYVPLPIGEETASLENGKASPIELFLAHCQLDRYNYETLYEKVRLGDKSTLLHFLEAKKNKKGLSFSKHSEILLNAAIESPLESALIFPNPPTISSPALSLASFSSLHKASSPDKQSLQPPSDYNCINKSAHTLPANSKTGLILHEIFEKIGFCAERKEIETLVHHSLEKSLYAPWHEVCTLLIENTLNATLQAHSKHFSLGQIKSAYREMPFLFDVSECRKSKIPEITSYKGLIKGVIDLLFYHEGRYYLLDWKTNWLGEESACYSQEKMKEAMEENHYFLQASLYQEAIRRYLQTVDKRPFEECFGGTFYLFVRGIEKGKNTGIYFF